MHLNNLATDNFLGADVIRYKELEFELVPSGACLQADRIERICEQVIYVAARSRGWNDIASLNFFRQKFKLGPLFEAQALALVRRNDQLVGLAGSVNDWRVPEGAIIHLCSLGLLPEVQAQGVLPVLMYLLWKATIKSQNISQLLSKECLFTSAITQSPYIFWFMSQIADVYPSLERNPPGRKELGVAIRVAQRFDAHLSLEHGSFILRNECEFRYKRLPYSPNRQINRFCDEELRYDQGDVFVLVGRVNADKINNFCHRVEQLHPNLVTALNPIRSIQCEK